MNYNFEYFENGAIYVVAIDGGASGFFSLAFGNTNWGFINRGSVDWDSLHQNIYRNRHDFSPCTSEEIVRLPPLPPVPEAKIIQWKDNFDASDRFPAKSFNQLKEVIIKNGAPTISYWIILFEDKYETSLGDGKFLYFEGIVFKTEKDATSFTLKKQKHWTEYHQKELKLSLNDDFIVVEKGFAATYEHYSVEKVIKRINEILSSDGTISWGEKPKEYQDYQ